LLISSFQGGKTPDERRSSIRFKRFESAFFARFQERVSTERSHYNVFRGDASRAFFDIFAVEILLLRRAARSGKFFRKTTRF
jgi:hypothetical protein